MKKDNVGGGCVSLLFTSLILYVIYKLLIYYNVPHPILTNAVIYLLISGTQRCHCEKRLEALELKVKTGAGQR